MNTSEHRAFRAHEVLAAQVHAAAPCADPAPCTVHALHPRDCAPQRLPVLHVPRLSWWQCMRLSKLDLPRPEAMVDEMAQAHRADDAPQAGDASLARHLEQIVQSCFAPEVWDTFDTYFAVQGAPGCVDADRALQAYALYLFITGSEDLAHAIAAIVPMTSDLRALRNTARAA